MTVLSPGGVAFDRRGRVIRRPSAETPLSFVITPSFLCALRMPKVVVYYNSQVRPKKKNCCKNVHEFIFYYSPNIELLDLRLSRRSTTVAAAGLHATSFFTLFRRRKYPCGPRSCSITPSSDDVRLLESVDRNLSKEGRQGRWHWETALGQER